MIVALYRIPGGAALERRYKDPLEQLRHGLARMYGLGVKPRPDSRRRKVSAGEHRIPTARSRLRRDRV